MRFGMLMAFVLPFALHAQMINVGSWKNLTATLQNNELLKPDKSNNNIDVVHYKDRYFLAFRTAPSHFPSSKAKMYVLSSPDLQHWNLEKVWSMGRDIREPRWAVINDSLYLFCNTGAKRWYSFKPDQLLVSATKGNGAWTPMQSTGLDGYVPWRVRKRDGQLFMSAYYGIHLYNKKHKGDLRLFVSSDGRNWKPITPEPQVDIPTAEEGEFIFDRYGNLYGTVRLESSGSLIVKASKDNPGKWEYRRSKFKYDSALLFEHKEEIYLVARRNLMGEVDRSKSWLGTNFKRMLDLAKYSLSGKVTALYRLKKDGLEIEHVMDFPSTGDNAFPALVALNDNSYALFNYSSDLEGPYKVWLEGQMGKTFIYYTTLTFSE